MLRLAIALLMIPCGGCFAALHTEFLSDVCIKPYQNYKYLTCGDIKFKIENQDYTIPKHFITDLASIPRIAWPIMSPSHSKLIRPAIVHDWFYRQTCEFTRQQTDLIFYSMLIDEGVSPFKASVMYYSIRLFGWQFYSEDYCE